MTDARVLSVTETLDLGRRITVSHRTMQELEQRRSTARAAYREHQSSSRAKRKQSIRPTAQEVLGTNNRFDSTQQWVEQAPNDSPPPNYAVQPYNVNAGFEDSFDDDSQFESMELQDRRQSPGPRNRLNRNISFTIINELK